MSYRIDMCLSKTCDIENEREHIDYALKRLPEEETIRKHIRLLEKYRLYEKVRDMIDFYRDLQEYTLPDDAIVCEPLLGTPPLEVSYF